LDSKYFDIISVADPGCLSRIRLFSFPDPGQKGTGSHIPDADLHTEYNLPWQTSTITVQGKLSVKGENSQRGCITRLTNGLNLYRLCKDLNLTIPGTPRQEKDEAEKKRAEKKKKKEPSRVTCERCHLSLRDKFVLKRHVSTLL